jgi:hypothetical protein
MILKSMQKVWFIHNDIYLQETAANLPVCGQLFLFIAWSDDQNKRSKFSSLYEVLYIFDDNIHRVFIAGLRQDLIFVFFKSLDY